ncbi:AAA family ATPase [Rhodococcus sp. BP-241]|uniref:DUF5925 domain-containing protein n=1 Tax=Rhodococcus sp. BP-241 TaxID=2739441 RepID=UPI001C9B5C68|nr:DUF5925 domain-containing protein [Rhodococcus sp. BP-241]MBY6706236.1 AAA family ATPase [Rhodococcus sp. BP-241]
MAVGEQGMMNEENGPAVGSDLTATFDVNGRYESGAAAVVQAEFTSNQMNGLFPFVVERSADFAGDVLQLIPGGLQISRHVETVGVRSTILAGDERCSMLIKEGGWSKVSVAVAASSLDYARDVANVAMARVPKPAPDDRTEFAMWHMDGTSPVNRNVRIDAAPWAEISRNYPSSVRNALTRLADLTGPTAGGRLILWHGAPGTGKTTAIRTLARKWSNWCRSVYIADPERLFADSAYLADVITKSPRVNGPFHDDRWQIIIAEDTDEYLRSSARRVAGAALGRLLNVTDGILGHGSKTLLLLTTNERIDRLHPALTRPGRCMANVEFTAFGIDEASHWLPRGTAAPSGPVTLAELFELSGGYTTISTQAPPPEHSGAYL